MGSSSVWNKRCGTISALDSSDERALAEVEVRLRLGLGRPAARRKRLERTGRGGGPQGDVSVRQVLPRRPRHGGDVSAGAGRRMTTHDGVPLLARALVARVVVNGGEGVGSEVAMGPRRLVGGLPGMVRGSIVWTLWASNGRREASRSGRSPGRRSWRVAAARGGEGSGSRSRGFWTKSAPGRTTGLADQQR